MKYISLDIETTGLDESYCQVLSIGAIIEDTSKELPLKMMPKFHCYIYHDKIVGQPYALNLNKNIIEILSKNKPDCMAGYINYNDEIIIAEPTAAVHMFMNFLADNEINISDFIVAGKNFNAFDKKFLETLPNWKLYFKPHRRVLDPATSLTLKTDTVPPDLKTCLERVGIFKEVAHDAVEDAFDVVQVLRKIIK